MSAAVPQFLNDLPLLRELTDDEVQQISTAAVRRNVSRNMVVQQVGDAVPYLGFILCGRGRESVSGPDGRTAVVRYLRGGDLFGEQALISSRPSPVTIECRRGTEVLMVGAETLRRLLSKSTILAAGLAQVLANRVSWHQRRLELMLFARGEERLVAYLQMLRDKPTDAAGPTPQESPGLTQEEIAADCGLTRETVSRLLARLRESGRVQRTQTGWLVQD